MEKKRFVEELVDGEHLDDLFLVKSSRLAETRAGKPFLMLTIGDRSGELTGPAWDNAEALETVCTVGSVVRIRGQIQTYNNKLQIQVKDAEAVDDSLWRPEDFVTASSRSQREMRDELDRLIGTVRTPPLRKLLKNLFNTAAIAASFQTAPAAKGIHHAYLGGLFEHSLSMAKVAGLLADHYPGIDRDLLIAGALLHDIGKTEELLNDTGAIDYTEVGRLKGHLVIGCELVGRAARAIDGFPEDLLTHLQHLVLSHHGRLEFGSPVVPMTPEALLLSFVDDLDAKMNLVEQLRRKVKGETAQWSDYQRSLERFLLLRPLGGGGERHGATEEKTEIPSRQKSLF
ncbi:3'-5' exoribonuclease YhaM family protein [Desulfofustis limnaeus]|jgi:3'-5' exoribonuclease|uniref:HD family phosphohydrolase n=1 Tax=Desulfofustis limnaeus TaxID=2740163 RepID=A0ABN6LYK8_9BACT|nr:HD domain-containing protein [Desulfofustis limnaeus]MDX9896085.1 HD domain-containing protein [Desulfofustis sp.]BDD85728.1 HD family phosphohydrolase [Desulfofustis limnaeus]